MYNSTALRLREHPLFSSFDTDYLAKMLKKHGIYPATYPRGSFLHSEDDICMQMDILLDGELEIQKIDENGNTLTVTKFYPISSLGENLLFGNDSLYPMNAFCPVDSEILHLGKEFILFLCAENQDFLVELLKDISNKALILTDKIKMISHKSLRDKVLDYLSRESSVQGSHRIRLRSSKKDLAQFFGVQRTSLSRELSKMRDEGLIEFNSSHITLK